ncbi:outer membrane protein assembly factor [Acidobacteria bacterium AH-259-G07]|nr:outer membrane protein assembly factor [Acidobacteria bacterium AH-259-G07]
MEKQLSDLPEPGPEPLLQKVAFDAELPRLSNVLNLHYKRLYPRFGSIHPDSGLAGGIRYWNPNFNGSFLDVQSSAALSAGGYQLYRFQFGEIIRREQDFFLYADLGYRYFPEEDFFGVGPESKEADRTDFVFEQASYDAVLGYQPNRWFGAAVRAGYLQMNTDLGKDDRFPATQELFDDSSASGLDRQPDFFRLNSGIFLDYRDVPGNPHRGGILSFSFSRFDDRGGRDFEFNRFTFDARHYIPLGSIQRVFALRFFTSFDDPDGESRVPFFLQKTLGGNEMLRGFRRFRFRDTKLLYVGGEYRWEAAPALEFAIFYEAGKVFSDFSDLDFTGLRKSFGGGVRFKTPNGVFMRIDIGHGDVEGTRAWFTFGPSF